MANSELIVDDEYCKKMGEYFASQGEQIDKCITDYVNILNKIKNAAIVSGETSKALATYISKAAQLKGQIKAVSSIAQSTANSFVTKVDKEDKYLF